MLFLLWNEVEVTMGQMCRNFCGLYNINVREEVWYCVDFANKSSLQKHDQMEIVPPPRWSEISTNTKVEWLHFDYMKHREDSAVMVPIGLYENVSE